METNLKPVRKASGLTQVQASELSGIPLGTLRRWEQGVNEPDMESVVLLARLYNVTTDTLLGSSFADNISTVPRACIVNVMNDAERDLLELFRNAEPTARKYAIEILENHQKSDTDSQLESA